MVKVGAINKNFPEHKNENYDRNKYVAAFAIATLTFIIGLLVGAYFMNQKIAKITEMEEAMKLDLASAELQDMLVRQEPCSPISAFEEKLSETESQIKHMESQLGKKDPKVLQLKKYYSLLELKHYLLMKDRKDKCGGDYHLTLFFYSNKDENLLESEKQGYALDSLRNRYGTGKLKTYSLDRDLDLDIIRTLVEFYKIESTPALVMDGKKYAGFRSIEEIQKILSLPELPASNQTNSTASSTLNSTANPANLTANSTSNSTAVNDSDSIIVLK